MLVDEEMSAWKSNWRAGLFGSSQPCTMLSSFGQKSWVDFAGPLLAQIPRVAAILGISEIGT